MSERDEQSSEPLRISRRKVAVVLGGGNGRHE